MVVKGKNAGDISMTYNVGDTTNANEPKVVPPKEGEGQNKPEIEEIKFEDVLVGRRNKDTGDVTYLDTDGNVVPSKSIDALLEIGSAPEYSQTGAEKEGELIIREVKYNEQGHENVQGDATLIAERQQYKDGDSWNATFMKSKYPLIKFLRSAP